MVACLSLLPNGFKGEPYRSTDGTIFAAAEGQGTTIIDGKPFEWGVNDVRATVDVRNHRSIALLTRLGFRRIAVRRSAGMSRCASSEEYVYRLRLDPPTSARQGPGEGAVTME